VAKKSDVWPIYFCTKPLDAARVQLRKGQPFPIQSKHYIRGLGRAYGVPDAETRDFGELPYVAVLNVQNEGNARNIIERGMSLDEAKKYVRAE